MFSMLLSSEEDFQVPMNTPEPTLPRHHSMIHHPPAISTGPTISPQSLFLPPPPLAPPILPPLPPPLAFQQARIGIPSLTSIPSISPPFPRPNQPNTSKRPDDDVQFVFEKPVKRRKLESAVPSATAGAPPPRVTDEMKPKAPSEAVTAPGLGNPPVSSLKPTAALLSLPRARPTGIPEANGRMTSLPSMENFAFPTSFPSGQARYSRSSPNLSPRQLPETIAPSLLQRGHSQPLLNNLASDGNPQNGSAAGASNVVSGVEGNSAIPPPAPANNTNSMVDDNSTVKAGPEPPPSTPSYQLPNGGRAAEPSTPTPAGYIPGRADGQNLGLATWNPSAVTNWSGVGAQESPNRQENVPEERPQEPQQHSQQDPRAIMSMILARTEQAQSWSSSSTESAHGDNDNVNSGAKPGPPPPSQSVQKVESEQVQPQVAQNNSQNPPSSTKNYSDLNKEPQSTPIPFTPTPSMPVHPPQVQSPPKQLVQQPVHEQLMQQPQMQCQPQLQAQTQMLQHQVQVQAGQRVGHHQSTSGPVKGPCRVCLALRQQAALQNAAVAAAAAAGGGGLSHFSNPALANGLMGGAHGHTPHNGTGYNFVFVPTPMQAGHTTPGAQFSTAHAMNMNAAGAASPALMALPPHQQYMLQNAQAQGMIMAPPALPAQPQMEAVPRMTDQTVQPIPNKSKSQVQQNQTPRKFAHQEPSAGKHIIVDIADTAMEVFPFGKVAKRHQVSVDKVRNIFEAVVAIPFLRIPADKRRAGKIGQDRVKKYVMTKKDLEKQNAMKGKKGEGVDGQPSMYEIARAMGPGEAPREWTHGFQGAW